MAIASRRLDGLGRKHVQKPAFIHGDVLIHVENRGADRVVTRIEAADIGGRVTRIDRRRRTIAVEVNGREETFAVRNNDVLDGVQEGDRIRFEVEQRPTGPRIITAILR